MTNAKREWNSRCKENAYRYIVGKKVNEAEFDRSGKAEASELLSHLPTTIDEWMVLDIGCGIGRLEKFLSDKFKEIHGVDVSDKMVSKGRERLKGHPNVFLHTCNGKDLSLFSDSMFDFIFSVGVFQHIQRKVVLNSYFKEAKRLLKPRGYFNFTVPYRRILFSKPKHLIKTLVWGYIEEKRRFSFDTPEGEPRDTDCFSTRFYGKEELEKHLTLNGFDGLSIKKALFDGGQVWVTIRKLANAT
jgi:ubiquinone/menaquinone biosynthesis C-methylase UbiE